MANTHTAAIAALAVEGAWVVTPRIHGDRRGSFLEWFKGAELQTAVGHSMTIAQANCSVSQRGVLRGIHFSDVPPGQAKYVTCVSGAILDVVVDTRAGSPGFGTWDAVELDDRSRRAVYIGEGLGHAFAVVSHEATVAYLCSTPYAPDREHCVNPLDPVLGIDWPADIEPVLSDKDAAAPTLAQARSAGLLPDYAQCQAYIARLRDDCGDSAAAASRSRSAGPPDKIKGPAIAGWQHGRQRPPQ